MELGAYVHIHISLHMYVCMCVGVSLSNSNGFLCYLHTLIHTSIHVCMPMAVYACKTVNILKQNPNYRTKDSLVYN